MLSATDEQRNRFKINQITGEAVDEFIRKMRITGIVSLRGNGRFIDFNSFEIEKSTIFSKTMLFMIIIRQNQNFSNILVR